MSPIMLFAVVLVLLILIIIGLGLAGIRQVHLANERDGVEHD